MLEEFIWSSFGGIVLNVFSSMYSFYRFGGFPPLVKTEDYRKHKFSTLHFFQVICVLECFRAFIKM